MNLTRSFKEPKMPSTPLFQPGRVVATAPLAGSLSRPQLIELVNRHLSGEIGLLSPEDAEENRRAIANGDRVFSHFDTPAGEVYVITDWDRSQTTVMFCGDY